ncbi:hypothetical protein IZ6_25380 [Terrihabitans soli]|uniref:Uncharacterized protein n=1 Tax=Terrihabitans soli TaxID=708113 RepID=A0A6S6QKH0_9HYPH|nr:hypothetical protein [Terrihabitans soli]BCJ91803.1 hypothetical protein IZ6_25380 [Terrihabitans soli]
MNELVLNLQKVREYLTPKGRWTQRALFRDAAGNSISTLDEYENRATCACLLGAIHISVPPQHIDSVKRAIVGQLPPSAAGVIHWFNDDLGTRQSDVLAVIDRAIEKVAA